MSLQKLGKKDSPPVNVNGVDTTENVVRGNFEKSPAPDFDPTKLSERARVIAEERAKAAK